MEAKIIPYIAHGSEWTAAMDVYNNSGTDTRVTVQYQDIGGVILSTNSMDMPAYGHKLIRMADLDKAEQIKTIILNSAVDILITAYQFKINADGEITGVAAIPIHVDTNLKN